MTNQKRNIAVGLFVTLAIMGILGLTLIIRGGFVTSQTRLRAAYNDVSGLEVGAAVLVAGVRAGRVSNIEGRRLEPQIVVHMDIDPKFEIREGAKARIVQQGFIGERRIEIYPGPLENRPLPDAPPPGNFIDAVEPFDMTRTFEEAQAILADTRQTVASVRELVTDDNNKNALSQSIKDLSRFLDTSTRILQENEANVKASIANLQELTERLKGLEERATKLVDTANAQVEGVGGDARATITEMRDATKSIAGKVEALTAQLSDRERSLGGATEELVRNANTNLKSIATNLESTSRSLDSILAKIDGGQGTIGLLVNDAQPFENLADSLEAIKNAILGTRTRIYDSNLNYVRPTASSRATPTPTPSATPSATPARRLP